MPDFLTDLADLATKEEEPKKDDASSDSQPENDQKKESPAPSQEEKPIVPEHSASEKEVPFHKHPRWIRQQQELKELKERMAKASETQKEVPKAPEKASSVPPQYQKLFGEDTEAFEAWKTFQREETRREAQSIYEERIRQEKEVAAQAEQAQQKAAQYAEDQFLELAEESGTPLHDRNNSIRNEILDLCLEKNLFDANGFPNVRLAFEFWQLKNPASTSVVDEKKKVAAKTNAKTNAASQETKVFTPSKLKKMNLEQFFN